jgi:hypothetical protein
MELLGQPKLVLTYAEGIAMRLPPAADSICPSMAWF